MSQTQIGVYYNPEWILLDDRIDDDDDIDQAMLAKALEEGLETHLLEEFAEVSVIVTGAVVYCDTIQIEINGEGRPESAEDQDLSVDVYMAVMNFLGSGGFFKRYHELTS